MTVKIRPYRKGGYEVDIMIRLANGKTHRERRKSPYSSKSASLRWGRERERHLLVHGPTPRDQPKVAIKKEVPTLAEFAPRFLAGYSKANGNKPSTHNSIESHLRVHLIPTFGGRPLDSLTEEDLQRFKASLSGRANKTINNILSTLNTLLDCAKQWGAIEASPVKAKRLRVPKRSMDFFRFDEYAQLVEAATELGPLHLAVALLGGDAGLRAGEIRGLHWASIEWNTRQLTVERSEWRGQFTTPKHDKIRVIPMTRRLTAALRQLERDRDHKHALVLADHDGNPLTGAVVSGKLTQALRAARLREKGPHTLRHTWCSHLAMRGVPARVIQQLAGHSKLDTTERYMHLAPGAVETASAALEAPPPSQAIPTRPDLDSASGDILETPNHLH